MAKFEKSVGGVRVAYGRRNDLKDFSLPGILPALWKDFRKKTNI